MSELTDKEKQIAATMLENYSEYLANRICNDFDWPGNWTNEEITKFTKDFHDWNGDPEEYEQGDILSSDHAVSSFLAHKLES